MGVLGRHIFEWGDCTPLSSNVCCKQIADSAIFSINALPVFYLAFVGRRYLIVLGSIPNGAGPIVEWFCSFLHWLRYKNTLNVSPRSKSGHI